MAGLDPAPAACGFKPAARVPVRIDVVENPAAFDVVGRPAPVRALQPIGLGLWIDDQQTKEAHFKMAGGTQVTLIKPSTSMLGLPLVDIAFAFLNGQRAGGLSNSNRGPNRRCLCLGARWALIGAAHRASPI